MISEFIEKIEADLQAKTDALNKRFSELDLREKEIESLVKDLNKLDKEVKTREKVVKARERDCELIEKKLEDQSVLVKMSQEMEMNKEQATKTLKEVAEKTGDLKMAQDDLLKRELALDRERNEYKAKIKQEFVDKFIGKL
jgi:hypothetical protein